MHLKRTPNQWEYSESLRFPQFIYISIIKPRNKKCELHILFPPNWFNWPVLQTKHLDQSPTGFRLPARRRTTNKIARFNYLTTHIWHSIILEQIKCRCAPEPFQLRGVSPRPIIKSEFKNNGGELKSQFLRWLRRTYGARVTEFLMAPRRAPSGHGCRSIKAGETRRA